MKQLKLMIPVRRHPNLVSGDINFIRNLLPELGKKFNVDLIWLVSIPKSDENEKIKSNENIVYFYDYNNIIEILDKNSPDLVIVRPSPEPVNLALLIACKERGIKIITSFFNRIDPRQINNEFKYSKKIEGLKINVRIGFSNRIRGDTSQNKSKIPFRTLVFFLQKYFFLMKTLKKSNYSIIRILKFNTIYFKLLFFGVDIMHPIFSGNLNLCSIEDEKKYLINQGFEKGKIKIIGNPSLDDLFEQFKKIKFESKEILEKPKILFCTTAVHEQGVITKNEEDDLILTVVEKIIDKGNEVNVKIHPTSSFLDEYEKLLHKYKNKITIYQKEELVDLLQSHDIMIVYAPTTAIFYGILSGKKLIYLNIFDKMTLAYSGLKEGIAVECKNVNDIDKVIDESKIKSISRKSIDDYIEHVLGKFDGRCSYRIVMEIENLMRK